MREPTISLVIPAYNEQDYLGPCLDAVLANAHGRFLEIIVVDNASTDRTAEVAAARPGVRVIREERKGVTRARQRGYLESKGDIIAFFDADTRMPAGWVEQVLKAFSNQDLGCLSGPYRYYDMSALQRFWVFLYFWVLAIPSSLAFGYLVIGGNFAVRRSVMDKINGFDTDIEFYGDDADIARRAHKHSKVKFSRRLVMPTSARRLHGQGVVKTAALYTVNYLSQAFLHRAVTEEYKDLR